MGAPRTTLRDVEPLHTSGSWVQVRFIVAAVVQRGMLSRAMKPLDAATQLIMLGLYGCVRACGIGCCARTRGTSTLTLGVVAMCGRSALIDKAATPEAGPSKTAEILALLPPDAGARRGDLRCRGRRAQCLATRAVLWLAADIECMTARWRRVDGDDDDGNHVAERLFLGLV